MKARPILFSAPMVRALLAGTKTQTRRLVKTVALDWLDKDCFNPAFVADPGNHLCPYGVPGDLLVVRETWRTLQTWDCLKPSQMAPDPSKVTYEADPENRAPNWAFGKTRVSIHMPRWASRLTLEITDVRVERLQSISESDAVAEGLQLKPGSEAFMPHYRGADDLPWSPEFPRGAYRDLWEKINGAGSWDDNPWVWAVTFDVHHQNVDTFIAGRTA